MLSAVTGADVALLVTSVPVLAATGYLAGLTLLSARRAAPAGDTATVFDIIVPAHNEAAGIAATVASLRALDYPAAQFRILVIADNCTDDTAARARAAGATVLEREHATEKGKGYALAHGYAASAADRRGQRSGGGRCGYERVGEPPPRLQCPVHGRRRRGAGGVRCAERAGVVAHAADGDRAHDVPHGALAGPRTPGPVLRTAGQRHGVHARPAAPCAAAGVLDRRGRGVRHRARAGGAFGSRTCRKPRCMATCPPRRRPRAHSGSAGRVVGWP